MQLGYTKGGPLYMGKIPDNPIQTRPLGIISDSRNLCRLQSAQKELGAYMREEEHMDPG